MRVRSCFAGMAEGLREHLVEGSESRDLFEYHRGRIAGMFASQPDLPLHQDTVAGFVLGFMVTGTYFVPDGSVEQESMFPVLGGALLLGQDLPLDADPDSTAGHGFVERATRAGRELDVPEPPDEICDLVRRAFALAPDVPMCYASLGGFCLGVLYTNPYLSGSDAGPAMLLAAACQLACDLPY
ncbi:MAG: hypothetical protein ACRDT0_15650 [Pseudonocardiaceae bacterium]